MKKILLTFISVLLLLTTINIGGVLAEESYYIDQGTPIYSSDKTYFTYPDISVTLTSDLPLVLSVTVSKGSVTLPTGTNTNNAKTFYDMESNGKHKSMNFFWSSGVSKDVIENILKALQFTYEDGMTITITMDGNETNIADKLSGVTGATLTQWEGNKHYYLYVPTIELNSDNSIKSATSWTDAYNAALDFKLGGMQGYLATFTMLSEQDVLENIAGTGNNAWVGMTALVNSNQTQIKGDKISRGNTTYASGFETDSKNYGKNHASEKGDARVDSPMMKYYYWACGPEAGKYITDYTYTYVKDDTKILRIYDVTTFRKEFNSNSTGTGWVVNMPANVTSQYESCVAAYTGNSPGLNDIPEGNYKNANNKTNISTTAKGYFVEFGDWAGHDSVDSSKVASFNITLKNEDKTNPKVKVESASIAVTTNNKTYDRANLSKSQIAGVTINGNTIDSDGYTIKFYDSSNNEISAPKDAGTYKVKVFVDNGTYIGESDYKDITISPISVSISGLVIKDKQYDNTTNAEKSNSTVYIINGLLSGDDVSVDDSEATYTFASVEKATNVNVTVTGMKLKGADAKNYTLSSQPSASASIVDPKINVDGKQYDGNPVSIESVTRYDSTNSKVVTIDSSKYGNSIKWYLIVDGNEIELNSAPSDAGQYRVKLTITGDDSYTGGDVSQDITIVGKEATLTITPKSKEYDGNANVLDYTYSFSGLIKDGDVTITKLTASYSDGSIGNDKSIVNNSINLGGLNVGNYIVKYVFNDGSITKRSITLKANDINVKVNESYDYSYTITKGSLLDGDTLNVKFAQGKPTSAGTYDINILEAKTNKDYYDVSTINGKLTIVDKTSDDTSNISSNTSSSGGTKTEANTPCEEWNHSKNWTWSESQGKCVYRVKNTSTN